MFASFGKNQTYLLFAKIVFFVRFTMVEYFQGEDEFTTMTPDLEIKFPILYNKPFLGYLWMSVILTSSNSF